MSKPDRKVYEQKPEQAVNFKGEYVVSSRQHPKIRVGNKERQPLIRTDMREAVRLTGQWRHRGHGYHLLINQAGPHIEMLLALVESGSSGKKDDQPRDRVRINERTIRLGGDVAPSDRTLYAIYLCSPDDTLSPVFACGTLKHFGAGEHLELTLDLTGVPLDGPIRAKLDKLGTTKAQRVGTTANLFEGHIGQPWIAAEARSRLWFPPTPKQIARLPGFILGARMDVPTSNYDIGGGGQKKSLGYVDMLRTFHVTRANEALSNTQRRLRLDNIAEVLDKLVWRAYQDALTLPAEDGGVDVFQRDFWRLATLYTLSDNSIQVIGQTQPEDLLTHTQDILDSSHGINRHNYEDLLHLQHRFGGHYYCAELDLVDVDGAAEDTGKQLKRIFKKYGKKYGQKAAKQIAKRLKRRLPVGALLGMMVVRKQDDPSENPNANEEPPEWEGHYGVELAGLKVGGSTGAGTSVLSSTGEAKHVYGQSWRPHQLEGPAGLIDAGGTVFGGGGGQGLSLTYLRCHGNGDGCPRVPLQLNFSGMSDVFGAMPGAGVSFSRFGGQLIFLDGHITDHPIEAPPEDRPFEYGAQTIARPLHFPINGAGLKDDGERLLQVFAATELALLRRKGVEIELDGYADQPHDEIHNMILSRNRAITVFNYLKNILEDDLPIQDLPEPPPEEEEFEEVRSARRKGEDASIFIPRADGATLRAHGEPLQKGEEGKNKPEYDQTLRRVDLSVDGVVSLSLRRTRDN